MILLKVHAYPSFISLTLIASVLVPLLLPLNSRSANEEWRLQPSTWTVYTFKNVCFSW